MNRRSTIAATGAAAGVLIAGTVAGVAIVKAANTHPVTEQVMLVADTSAEPVAAPSFAPSSLPEVSMPSTASTSPAPQPVAAEPTVEAVTAPKPIVTRVQARQAVLAQVSGTVVSVHLKTHGGYDAYAVKVQRNDGSVVIGYVDAASGVVFDWTPVSGPTPTATTTPGESDDHESDDTASSGEHDHDSDDD